MNDKKYDYFLVRNKMKNLLRFSYDHRLGIYYEVLINGKWQKKRSYL